MTRLFIRFYIGVIIILFVGLCIMSFAFQNRFDADFDRIKEKAMGDGVSRVRESLNRTSGEALADELGKLQADVHYPIRVISGDQVPDDVQTWLSTGDDVMIHVGNELSVLTRLEDGTKIVSFGPVSLPQGSVETDMKISLGMVLLLVAIAIAILLRPLARQLSLLEHTAISFAGGDLGARVDVTQASSAKALAQALNDMAARTGALLRTQRELLQAVSHELRTPLARINFAIDLIRMARDERERELRLRSLDTAAQELDELVGELLQYVRLETSGPQADWESIDLLPLVEELIERNSLVGEAIQFEIGPELARGDVCVVADRSAVARAVGNLLGNARRFARRRVLVDACASPTGTTIHVDDDGPGIPESQRERVFEPFVRLEETGDGVGLGLALVKRIVGNHGGAVAVLKSLLGGCRIRVFLPAVAEFNASTGLAASQTK
jgi:two-component system sensor histidine kinase RstB